MRRAVLTATAVLLSACASPPEAEFSGSVALGPGGRAEGRLVVPANSVAKMELRRVGSGTVEYTVKDDAGRTLAHGPVDRASFQVGGTQATTATIALRNTAGPGLSVGYVVIGPTALALTWDLDRAQPQTAP